jgi:hypothetical protein
MKFDARRKKLARIETAVAALRSQRKVLRVIVDQAEEAEERMQASLAEHLAAILKMPAARLPISIGSRGLCSRSPPRL